MVSIPSPYDMPIIIMALFVASVFTIWLKSDISKKWKVIITIILILLALIILPFTIKLGVDVYNYSMKNSPGREYNEWDSMNCTIAATGNFSTLGAYMCYWFPLAITITFISWLIIEKIRTDKGEIDE